MTDSTPTSQPPVSSPAPPRRRFFRWAAIVTAVAALGAVVGLKAYAHVGGFGGWHRGGFMGAHLDPAHLDAHLDRMLKHFYVEIDATEAQKQALAPIVKSAARDLVPLHDRLHAARDRRSRSSRSPPSTGPPSSRCGRISWRSRSRRPNVLPRRSPTSRTC
jgi:periplasmic protein CpxP/Spy